MEGVTSRQKEDVYQEKKVLKILLRSARRRGRAESSSQSEAVQLHFITPYWDLEVNTIVNHPTYSIKPRTHKHRHIDSRMTCRKVSN